MARGQASHGANIAKHPTAAPLAATAIVPAMLASAGESGSAISMSPDDVRNSTPASRPIRSRRRPSGVEEGSGAGREVAGGRVDGRSIASRHEPGTHDGCSQHRAVRIELLMRCTPRAGVGVERGPSGEGRPARAERPPAVSRRPDRRRRRARRRCDPCSVGDPPVGVRGAQPLVAMRKRSRVRRTRRWCRLGASR